MKTINGKIATEPFPGSDLRIEVKKGFAYAEQKRNLQALKVVFNGDGFFEGDIIYVPGDVCKMKYASEIFEMDGKKFILLPKEMVCIVDSMDKK